MKQKITLRRFDDMHCHLRTGSLLEEVLPFTVRYASRAVVMPNIRPRSIITIDNLISYCKEIDSALDKIKDGELFEPIVAIEIRDNTTPEMIEEASSIGVLAGKVYPIGTTTNSDEGLRDFDSKSTLEIFRTMEKVGMILLIHGEESDPNIMVTKREEAFLPRIWHLAVRFPQLKIVLEHITTRSAVMIVRKLGKNVAATITAHHLCLTLNDVIGYGIRPHYGCMPMPKGFDDRDALIDAATSGDPKFFFGSDSAPHLQENKESAVGACGIYSAPVVPQVLAEVFEKAGKLDRLEDFTSKFGAEF
ncbi:MAG: dihydroorotase [Candidatus Pacebacteria bacterium]|nr:dihydroorotase [Candidatus Paceibacterota bacterium]